MKKFIAGLLNVVFFTVVLIMALSISTIALTKKVNDYRNENTTGVQGTVIKQVVPVLSFTKGVVRTVNVKVGQEIKKDEVLVEMDNPLLRSKVKTLEKFPNNLSAETEAEVGREELKTLTITSPVDGFIGEIQVTEGSVTENLAPVVTIYAHQDIRVLVELSSKEYQAIKNLSEIKAYSERLNQTFVLKPDILKPDESTEAKTQEKKIGLYFTIKNTQDAKYLLNNEDLDLYVDDSNEERIARPIDIVVNFWNNVLGEETI